MKNKILIIVAHPDDETLGCGGAIARHVRNNDKVFCISFTNGVSERFVDNVGKQFFGEVERKSGTNVN